MPQNPLVQGQGRWISSIWLAITVGCVYICGEDEPRSAHADGVAVFWPAAGVARHSDRRRPRRDGPVAAGVWLRRSWPILLGDRNLASSVVFALCNAGEALLAAWLIERTFGRRSVSTLAPRVGLWVQRLSRPRCPGSADPVDSSSPQHDRIRLRHLAKLVRIDALGIVTIAPLVDRARFGGAPSRRRRANMEGLLACIARGYERHCDCASARALDDGRTDRTAVSGLLWTLGTLPAVFAAAATFIVTLRHRLDDDDRIGHFAIRSADCDALLAARAGFWRSRSAPTCSPRCSRAKATRSRAGGGEARLRGADGRGHDFVWDVGSMSCQRSANARRSWVRPAGKPLAERFSRAGVSGDRERLRRSCACYPEPCLIPSPSLHYSDGREVTLEETAKAEFDGVGVSCASTASRSTPPRATKVGGPAKMLIGALDHAQEYAGAHCHSRQAHEPKHGSREEYIQALDRRIQSMADATGSSARIAGTSTS